MLQANREHTSRRAPIKAGQDDAELLALVREFNRIGDKITEHHRLAELDEEYLDPLYEELQPVEKQIIETPARTLAGLSAKAAVCYWCNCGQIDPDPDGPTFTRVAKSILTDLMRLRGVVPMSDHEFQATFSAAKYLPDLV